MQLCLIWQHILVFLLQIIFNNVAPKYFAKTQFDLVKNKILCGRMVHLVYDLYITSNMCWAIIERTLKQIFRVCHTWIFIKEEENLLQKDIWSKNSLVNKKSKKSNTWSIIYKFINWWQWCQQMPKNLQNRCLIKISAYATIQFCKILTSFSNMSNINSAPLCIWSKILFELCVDLLWAQAIEIKSMKTNNIYMKTIRNWKSEKTQQVLNQSPKDN